MIELKDNEKFLYYTNENEYTILETKSENTDTSKYWIQTYTGKKIILSNFKDEDICIEDIAHSLSLTNRFNGHLIRPYSVAEHSVRVCDMVWQATNDKSVSLHALLHDGSEFLLADVMKPYKISPEFSQYRKIEKVIQSRIYKKFGLDEEEPAIVKEMDCRMLSIEAVQLMKTGIESWNLVYPPDYEYCHKNILGWDWKQAEEIFLRRFVSLTEDGSL